MSDMPHATYILMLFAAILGFCITFMLIHLAHDKWTERRESRDRRIRDERLARYGITPFRATRKNWRE